MLNLNEVYCGNAYEILKCIDDKSIDLVVTSPPYDNLRKYNSSKLEDDWNEEIFKCIAKELKRVLKDGGVIVWNVFDKVENGSRTGTSLRQCLYFQEIGLNINDYMIFAKTNPMPQVRQPRYASNFEFMWVLSKGKPKTFNPIMRECKCAGQAYNSTCKNMGGESGRTHKNFNINKQAVDYSIWNMAVAKNNTNHTAVYPYELPYKHIQTWTNEGDIVLDPFMGSGTTALAAIDLKRNFIGSDVSQEYVDLCHQRIKEKIDCNKLV